MTSEPPMTSEPRDSAHALAGAGGEPIRLALVGPELACAYAPVIEAMVELCDRYGFRARWVEDPDWVWDPNEPGMDPLGIAAEHVRALEGLVEQAHAVVAHLSPFRGASADVGAVYALGYARARGRPVFGYTNQPGAYGDRVCMPGTPSEGSARDANGFVIEALELFDRATVQGSIAAEGRAVVLGALAPQGQDWRYGDLGAFEGCLVQVRAHFAAPGSEPTHPLGQGSPSWGGG